MRPEARHPLRRHQPVGDGRRDLQSAMALDALGDRERALQRLLREMQHLRSDEGKYWTTTSTPTT